MSVPIVSIGIISFNAREFLDRCISSVLNQVENVSLEVIVVDNASTDGSADLVREKYPEVILIEEKENRGYGAAANRAFSSGSGRFNLLLNSDIELKEGCLAALIRFMNSHPEAGIVGCRLLETDGSIQRTCRSFPSFSGYLYEATFLYRLFPGNRIVGRYHLTYMDYGREAQVEVPLGALFFVRREVWEKNNGMDERFFMYSEETDFCFRASRSGWEIWYTPEGTAVHHGAKSTGHTPARMFVENHRSKLLFMRLHRGVAATLAIRLILLFGTAVRAVIWSGLWAFSGFLSQSKRDFARNRLECFWQAAAFHAGFIK